MNVTPQAENNEEYAGPSRITISAGKGFVLSIKLSVLGALIGSAIGFFSSDKNGMFTKRGTDLLKALSFKDPEGKWVVALGGAVIGGFIGKYVGLAIGTKRALKETDPGREQFERIKSERDAYAAQTREMQREIDTHKRERRDANYSEQVESRMDTGSHAAAHEAEKTAAIQAEPIR